MALGDSIERGLQNQYQRWGYNPEMLYGWPFHKKHIEISLTISIFEVADFSMFLIMIFDDLIKESYTAFCQEFHCGNAGPIE